MDGLIWCSRLTESGMRRVNYYVKHLIIDEEGELSKTLSWIAITVLISDLVWRRILVGLGNPG